MTYAPTNPLDVPPYQLHPLISDLVGDIGVHRVLRVLAHLEGFDTSQGASTAAGVRCGQALGSEIYVGCSNGELLRFALQADDPSKLPSYALLSRQTLPNEKPIEEIVLVPRINRALILSDRQIYFYSLPNLDPVSSVKPIRHVVAFAVDHQHLKGPAPSLSGAPTQVEHVDFCVIKRTNIALYSLGSKDRLFFQKEIPLPQGATLARRTGRSLCVADKENYNIIDLESAAFLPLLPLSQAPDTSVSVKPFITVISDNEFLILSWTGGSTLGVFITGDGDPVRGTLEWPSHPESICLDYPYITTLLPNNTIEIHSVETQTIVQVVSASPSSPSTSPGHPAEQLRLAASLSGYLVPSTQRSDKMRMTSVPLVRPALQAELGTAGEQEVAEIQPYDLG